MEELGHQNGFYGGADLQHELVTRGDSQAEAFGNLAEGVAGGEAPNAHRHALPHRDRLAEHRVFLGDGGVQMLADHVEGGLAHAEVAPEFLFREVRLVAALPPVLGAILDPQAALLLLLLLDRDIVDVFNGTTRSLGWGGGVELELSRIHEGLFVV